MVLCFDEPANPPDTSSADGGVRSVQVSTERLRPASGGVEQDRQARILLSTLVGRCLSDRAAAERRCEQAQQAASVAEETIASMRGYAIDRHRDGEICRQGLNDFLRAHGLEPYAPTFDATVEVILQVTVGCEPDEDRDDIDRIIERNLVVDTEDPSSMQVHDFSLAVYDAVCGVEELPDPER